VIVRVVKPCSFDFIIGFAIIFDFGAGKGRNNFDVKTSRL
jgi:hypothetical protein